MLPSHISYDMLVISPVIHVMIIIYFSVCGYLKNLKGVIPKSPIIFPAQAHSSTPSRPSIPISVFKEPRVRAVINTDTSQPLFYKTHWRHSYILNKFWTPQNPNPQRRSRSSTRAEALLISLATDSIEQRWRFDKKYLMYFNLNWCNDFFKSSDINIDLVCSSSISQIPPLGARRSSKLTMTRNCT